MITLLRLAPIVIGLLGVPVLAQPAEMPATRSFERARNLVDAGSYREAIRILREQPASAETSIAEAASKRLLAQALLGNGEYAAAAEAARNAVALTRAALGDVAPETADAWLVYASAQASKDHPGPEGAAALEQALRAAIASDGPQGLRTLRVQDRIAAGLSAQGRLADAEAIVRDTLAKAEALEPGSQHDRLQFTNTLGITLLRQSKFEPARAAFAAAYEGRRALISDRHPDTLDSLHNLGVALRRLGHRDAAEQTLGLAASLRAVVLGSDHPDTLTTRTLLVRQMLDRGAAADARAEAGRIVEALTSRLGEAHLKTLQAMGDFASALSRSGKRSEALRTYRRAFDLGAQALGEHHPETLSLGHEYSSALYQSGQFAEALRILKRVLQGTRSLYDDEHRDTLATLHSIAVVEQDLGRLPEAEEIFRYVLSVMDRQGSAHHPQRVTVQNNLATVLRARGKNQEALGLISDVVATRTRDLGPEHSLTLLSRSNLAATLAALGQYEEAIAIHRDVLAARTRLWSERHPDTLKSLHNLASTLDEAGETTTARDAFAKVVALRRETLGPTHPDTVLSTRALAGVLSSLGAREEARQRYGEVVAASEVLRSQGGLPETARRDFFSTVVPAYKALAFLEAELSRYEAAFAAAELAKARTLAELAATRDATRTSVLPERERSRLSEIETGIARLDAQIPSVREPAQRAALEAERDGLRGEFQDLHAGLQARYPKYRAGTDVPAASAADLSVLLPPDSALLQFLNLGPRTLLVWATGTGERGLYFLPDAVDLPAMVEAYRLAVARRAQPEGSRGGQSLTAPPPSAADLRRSLSDLLFSQLPPAIRSSPRWLISPDGPLALLPFDALEVGGESVVEHHEVSLIQSVSMLRLLEERRHAYAALERMPMLAVGDPVYEAPDEGAIVVPSAGPNRVVDAILQRARDSSVPHKVWRNLPGAGRELAVLSGKFGLVPGRTLFVREDASERQVRALNQAGELARYRYLIFSAHGDLESDPRLSAIVLSQVGLDATDDGYLRASELTAYDLRSDLLVVSACDSGVGQLTSGEGVVGLPFALFVAGTRSTVLTLWPVYDEGTAEFMNRFFERVRMGAAAGLALAQTKREFARGEAGEALRSPAYWAAFVLYGS